MVPFGDDNARRSWSSGTYVHEGTGNITRIGPAWFTYDKVNRLTAGNVYTDPLGAGTGIQQGYTFDPFVNLTAITGANARNTPTAAATNRLTSGTYDAAGNLTNWNGAVYQYDRFNQMLRMTSGSQDWAYVYTADDERIWSYDLTEQEPSRWTLRDLSGQVLREYQNDNGAWTIGTDYIHRNGQLLAAETRLGRRHFHLDHLGTPRLITNSVGYKTAYHVYYPFGEEATAFNQDGERMKFTGHERDLASPAGAGDDLDYMHARHYSPVTGRFLSVDPLLDEQATVYKPQKWNRYSYVVGNPLKYNDLNGQEENLVGGGTVVNNSSQDVYIAFDADRMAANGANLDVIVPLHPGESSEMFTYDADAVVVAPGQSISGAEEGSFKVSAGTVEVKDGENGKLVLFVSATYRAMKARENPADRSGHQSAKQTPQQWRVSKTPVGMERDRQRTAATRESREKRAWERKRKELWDKLKRLF